MKTIKLTKLVLPKDQIAKLSTKEKKRYIMFTCMIRDLNLLQKCLLFSNNVPTSDKVVLAANSTVSLFFLKTLISKIHEMWTFLNKNQIKENVSNFSLNLNKKLEDIEKFFSDKKRKSIIDFIRNKFGFHYEYWNDVDEMIDSSFNEVLEFEIWHSEDSANEIFKSSNDVILNVIFIEMKNLGFQGDETKLFEQLYEVTLTGARLFREFSIHYLRESFDITWDQKEKVLIEVPQFTDVKLPLLVSK